MDKQISQKLKNLTILYAEDEDGIRENVADSLSYYAKNVIQAKNGLEAYELYEIHKPDIVYTDIMMPILNGIELAEKIRQQDLNTPIVMISAHTDKDYLLRAVSLHLEQYIVKPIKLKELKQSLQKCVSTINIQHSITTNLPDGYSYDFDKKTLFLDKNPIKLTKKEVAFFELLLQNMHRYVSYLELQDCIRAMML